MAEGRGPILDHADVRRMLLTMKAETFAARSIALACAVAIDMSTATHEAEWTARAALLTPIAKAFGTDTGIRVAEMGVQVHGGMGFVEETGAAQYSRDVRVTAIYEGTNGIQAMDLVGRKMMDGGEAAFRLLDEIEAHAETARATHPAMAGADLAGERDPARGGRMAGGAIGHDHALCRVGPLPARLCAGAGGALSTSRRRLPKGDEGPRVKLARFYVNRLLPEHASLLAQAMAGADDLYAMTDAELCA